jgi:hypothetical protein
MLTQHYMPRYGCVGCSLSRARREVSLGKAERHTNSDPTTHADKAV